MPIFVQIYCFALILLGFFFLLNLILVVIVRVFMKIYANEVRTKIEEEKKEQEEASVKLQ